ncbi:MAG TPA: HIT domain-containing protein [Rudaea sp.]|jgi:diadenosine tetraphosphate (Ap4A) HIT family hydrolase|uniref:HIT domain-containing protein n=1 Tax=Rudaea sp. TaxID=2136325 RepID=UPI002F948BC8
MPGAVADFAVDRQLVADTHRVGDLSLSRVLLMDDARFPWLILVPRVTGMRDLIDLPRAQQHALLDEVESCAQALRRLYAPDKLNIAALGNVIAQLHVHVIARFARDAAWPRPVWGVGERVPYTADPLTVQLAQLRAALDLPPAP